MTPIRTSARTSARTSTTTKSTPPTSSAVHLIGRLGKRIEERELPSGDLLTEFSIVVDRPPRSGSSVTVDTIACRASKATIRRRVASMEPGTVVEATGRLSRRFWRGPGGLGSALEVDIDTLALCT